MLIMRDNSGNFLKLSFCILVLHPGFQVSAVSPYIGKTAMCGNFFTACRRVFFPVSDSGLNPEPVQFLIKGTETFFHDNGYIFPIALYRICQFADFQVRIQVKPVLGQCCPYFGSVRKSGCVPFYSPIKNIFLCHETMASVTHRIS